MSQEEKYPQGHFLNMWIGIGVAIGSGLGVAIGLILGNMAFIGTGIPIGIAIGAGIGASQEAKYQKAGLTRPLHEEEKRQKQVASLIGLILVLVGVLVLAVIMLK